VIDGTIVPNPAPARPVLVNGEVGVVVAPQGRLTLALAVTIEHGKITSYELIAEPDRLARLELATLDTGER
jgi:RNA polymerase sigma-70 factor (ECF subfamily)